MEGFLRRHAGFRWFLILGLLLGIFVEGMLIYNQVAADQDGLPGDDTITDEDPSGEVRLACTVVSGVNLRSGPSVEFDTLGTLDVGQTLTAVARNGPVPWLLVELPDGRTGWSSTLSGGEPLIQCDGDVNTLPERQPDDPTGAAEPTEEAAPPTEAVAVLAPPDRARSGNGPDLLASRAAGVTVDGDLAEWGDVPAAPISSVNFGEDEWTGPADLSGTAQAMWDEDFLYLALRVQDDRIVQEGPQDQIYRGDAVEFFWDRDLVGDFDSVAYNEDDLQVAITPGNFVNRPPSSWVWAPPAVGNFRQLIAIGARPTAEGYTMEIRLPWEQLGVVPLPGAYFGYALALSDDDAAGSAEQETQIATSNRLPYPNPTYWSNLILQP